MAYVQKIVSEDSFDATNTLVPAGHVGTFDEARLTGDEKHLADLPSGYAPVAIEISSFAPTGPNPSAPQQISSDTVQLPGGAYGIPGKILVAERTINADQRLAGVDDPNAEDKVSQQLAELGLTNAGGTGVADGAAKVDGTVASITADLGGKTVAELQAIRSAEADGQNRATLLAAVDKELAAR